MYVHSTQWRLPTLFWALCVQRGSTLESMLWDFCNGVKAKHQWERGLGFGIWFFQDSVLRYSRMRLAVAGGCSSVSALRSRLGRGVQVWEGTARLCRRLFLARMVGKWEGPGTIFFFKHMIYFSINSGLVGMQCATQKRICILKRNLKKGGYVFKVC